ncbi:MAG: hypothetical protein Q4C60_09550 [Eubacteriales bacterium]|nr:hypothetical protein [Eubacteriales bacterium]
MKKEIVAMELEVVWKPDGIHIKGSGNMTLAKMLGCKDEVEEFTNRLTEETNEFWEKLFEKLESEAVKDDAAQKLMQMKREFTVETLQEIMEALK